MRYILLAIALLLVPSAAQAQADPWHLIITVCQGNQSTTGTNEFARDLQGNPNVSVDTTTQTSLDCVAGTWPTSYSDLPTCNADAAPLQQHYDTANALGFWDVQARCQTRVETCDWWLTVYPPGQAPQEFLDWHNANCQGT